MSRIAFMSTMEGIPWGGSEDLWCQTATRLARQGHLVGANVMRWPQTPGELLPLKEAGGQITTRVVTLRRFRSVIGDPFRAMPLKWLTAFRPDLVVFSLAAHTMGLEWMQACRARGIPYALIIQSVLEPNWPDDGANAALADVYRAAKAVYFVSQGNADFVQMQLAVALPQAQVVRNPFKVRYEAAPLWPGDTQTWDLACVGRLDARAKGQDILFSVLKQDKWKQRPLTVTLYGRGENESSLRRMKDFFALDKVTFGSYTSDIEALWGRHHGLVMASRYEGLPLVIVEAMLCARPCIVTRVAGNAELMENDVSGFVAGGAAPHLLDEAMERAWQRRDEWQEIGQKAATRVRELVPPDPSDEMARTLTGLLD